MFEVEIGQNAVFKLADEVGEQMAGHASFEGGRVTWTPFQSNIPIRVPYHKVLS